MMVEIRNADQLLKITRGQWESMTTASKAAVLIEHFAGGAKFDPYTCGFCNDLRDVLGALQAIARQLPELPGNGVQNMSVDQPEGPEDGFMNDDGSYGRHGRPVRQSPPPEILDEIQHMQDALADLLRALMYGDDTYIVKDLDKLLSHRQTLVGACQTWRPHLRIA